jgi:formiminotetrahydrofolate cyclodeaminase
MGSFTNLQLRELINAFASATPAPGGGSAAALAGATGASLLLMAIGVRLPKSTDSKQSKALTTAADWLRSRQTALMALIDRDAEAYSSVVAALRMPAGPDEADGDRQTAINSALRGATEVPLETMRACRDALREAPAVAAFCSKSTRADVAVAIELLNAAVRGSGLTVDANLDSLSDVEYVSRVRGERQRLESEGATDAEQGRSQLFARYRLSEPS